MYTCVRLCVIIFLDIFIIFLLAQRNDKVVQRSDAEPPQPRLGLTAARMALRKSQQEVADDLGTTHVNVSRWERGITKPNPYFRRKLCKLFGKTEEELDLVIVPVSGRGQESGR